MKTSNVLASLLFGSFAVAAPLERRYLKTKTELVVVTEVVFTTVYEGQAPLAAAAATTSAVAVFAEKPASSAAVPTSYPAARFSPPTNPSSVYVAPASVAPVPSAPEQSAPAPVAPVPSAPAQSAPVPVASAPALVAPAPVSNPAPAQSSTPSSTGGGGGKTYNGDITIYDNTGAAGACGKPLTNDMDICAVGHILWDAAGGSTYDRMTGVSTNPYCGKTATIHYNGRTTTCVIQDLCPGCGGDDLDLSHAVWQKATGGMEITRHQATWSIAM